MEINYVPQDSFIQHDYNNLYDVSHSYNRSSNTQTAVVDYGRHLTRAGTTL